MVRYVVEDEVVARPTLGEIFLGVVDDVVCADRSDHVHVPCAADSGHFRSQRFGYLNRERPHASRRTIDQHLLSRLNLPVIAKSPEGDESGNGHGRGLLKREVSRFQRQLVYGNGHILGKGAFAHTEYLVTRLNLRHVLAARLDVSCHSESRNLFLGLRSPNPMRRRMYGRPLMMSKSPGWTAAAWTRTSTSSSLTAGLSMSLSSRTSVEP
jgi:hypothetical protein